MTENRQTNEKEYTRIGVYVPTKVSEDTAFPFKPGQPCLVKIDESKTQLTVKPISEKDAIELGWRKRSRKKTWINPDISLYEGKTLRSLRGPLRRSWFGFWQNEQSKDVQV